jgi:hypothetical protein
MKTTIKKMTLGVIIVLFALSHAIAFEDSIRVKEEKSFDLFLTDVSKTTQITLKDRRNNILYKHSISEGESYSKTFNLEFLAAGDYIVEIENDLKIKKFALEVTDDELYANATNSDEVFKPVVTGKGEVVYVTQFSPDQSPLYVAIYNFRNELVHEEFLSGKMDLGKKFDFSNTLKGEYRFYLVSKGLSYDHLVYVEK